MTAIVRAVAAAMSLTVVLGAAKAQEPDKQRLALIIAVSDYDGDGRITTDTVRSAQSRGRLRDLPTPIGDAELIAAAVARAEFSTDVETNLDHNQMKAAVSRFGSRLAVAPRDSTAIVYFAGHGAMLRQGSFIFPRSSVVPANSSQVGGATGAVSVDDLLSMLGPPTLAVWRYVVLDACRDNPWEAPAAEEIGLWRLKDSLGRGPFADMLGKREHRNAYPYGGSVRSDFETIVWSTGGFAPASDGIINSPFAQAFAGRLTAERRLLDIFKDIEDDVRATTGGRQWPSADVSATRASLLRCIGPCR